MKLYRQSDTGMYLLLKWFVFLAFNLWLFYFGVLKILEVQSRQFLVQSLEVYASTRNAIVPYPDIIICAQNATVSIANNSGLEVRKVNGRVRSFCAEEFMTIISAKNNVMNINQPILEFGISFVGNLTELPMVPVLFMTNANNPWGSTTPRGKEPFTGEDYVHDLLSNYYLLSPTGSGLAVHMIPQRIWAVQDGFLGYFGVLEKVPRFRVTTTSSAYYYRGGIQLNVFTPRYWLEQKQKPIATVTSAFASWGGAFSAIWGIFYLVFGSPRLDPFGLYTVCCRRRKTKDNFARDYHSWKEPSPHPIKSQHRSRRHSNDSTVTSSTSSSSSSISTSVTKELNYTKERLARVESQLKDLHHILQEYYLDMDLIHLEGGEEKPPWTTRLWKRIKIRWQKIRHHQDPRQQKKKNRAGVNGESDDDDDDEGDEREDDSGKESVRSSLELTIISNP